MASAARARRQLGWLLGQAGPRAAGASRGRVRRATQRLVLGANTYRLFAHFLASGAGTMETDEWVTRMLGLPATVVSNTLQGPLDRPGGTVANGDAVDIVARLKEESEVPLRSHGSLSLNRALMAAGLVDRVQVTLFPVITGQTGTDPVFAGRRRLRPRADRQQDPRRQHPRTHLRPHPASLSATSRRALTLRARRGARLEPLACRGGRGRGNVRGRRAPPPGGRSPRPCARRASRSWRGSRAL